MEQLSWLSLSIILVNADGFEFLRIWENIESVVEIEETVDVVISFPG